MAERTEREVLNALIVACKDADRGFTFAAEHVVNSGLKTLLAELAAERRRYAEALLPHAQRLGGAGETDGSPLAALHRAWMAVKGHVAHADHAILAEAERGERAAATAYDKALNGMLPPDARDIVEQQRAGIDDGLRRLRALTITAA